MRLADRPVFATVWRLLPAAATMSAIFALSAQRTLPRMPPVTPNLTQVVGHFSAYALLTLALWWALPARELTPRLRLGAAFVGAVIYGASDEWHQAFVPGRDPALVDLVVDAAGAAFALVVIERISRSVVGAGATRVPFRVKRHPTR
jgi:VanZ family protein